jgi:hypothetical protein
LVQQCLPLLRVGRSLRPAQQLFYVALGKLVGCEDLQKFRVNRRQTSSRVGEIVDRHA